MPKGFYYPMTPVTSLTISLSALCRLFSSGSITTSCLKFTALQLWCLILCEMALDMATSCYEFACSKYPNNLELMMGLFSCYVREYSFVKQQQIAIKMYRIAGEERFLMWEVCSIQLQEPSSDIIDWINFCIFLNAWKLISHEIVLSDRSDPTSGTWHIVNSLLRKSIIEKINSAGPVVSSPGATLPFLVQLITEPLSGHGLIIQSCVRSLVPSGKKKKKGGSTEQSNSQISYTLQNSIRSLCDTIQ